MKNFKLSIQEVYDMPWAEFVLRSIGFKEEQEFTMMMFREVAYECYKNGFVFTKSKPVDKNKFWKIGHKKVIKKEVPKEFLEARANYLNKRK